MNLSLVTGKEGVVQYDALGHNLVYVMCLDLKFKE